jgi:hypothetical protein
MCCDNADVVLHCDGSLWSFEPNTPQAEQVLAQMAEPAFFMGRVLCVDDHNFGRVLEQVRDAGLTVDPGDTGLAL